VSATRIGVDVGGTFTDVILHEASGRATIRKLLSTPPSYDVAVVEAVAELVAGAGARPAESGPGVIRRSRRSAAFQRSRGSQPKRRTATAYPATPHATRIATAVGSPVIVSPCR
jgi:predicted NBD/HSP70 family sugar kinase